MRTLRSYWWVLAVALIAILLKALLLTPWVAGKAETAAVDALGAAGLTGVTYAGIEGVDGLGGDGLNVILEGPAADEAAAVAAVEARDEVNRAVYRPTDQSAVATTDTTEVADAGTDEGADDDGDGDTAPAVDLASPELGVAISPAGVILTGVVASESVKAEVVEAARARYGITVDDRLRIDDAVAPDGGQLTVSGLADSEGQRTGWLDASQVVADTVGFDVVDNIELLSVTDQLNDLFELEPIQFDVSRSTIRPDSVATLDRAAEVINANPEAGRLRVVGHTDADGAAAANQRLSEARAAAVVAFLVETGAVDAERLEAEGRGETELLVDPELTLDDKQRNRRIEWELIG